MLGNLNFGKLNRMSTIGLVAALFIIVLGITTYILWSSVNFRRPVDPRIIKQAQQQRVADIIKSGDLDGCVAAQGLIIDGVNQETVCRNNIAYKLAIAKN